MTNQESSNQGPCYPGLDSLESLKVDKALSAMVPYSFAKKNLILPVNIDETGAALVVIADPSNLDALEELKWIIGKRLSVFVSKEDKIREKLSSIYQSQESRTSEIIANLESQESIETSNEIVDLLEQTDQNQIISLLNEIIKEAIQQRASDIHFEPLDTHLQIRYRIDGVLQKRHRPATEHQAQLITRIKVLAKMDIAQRRLPQDGSIKMLFDGREIDFRISTIPVVHGERIVMRILDKQNVILGLNQIGMPRNILKKFGELISLPEGIILVTGPTGSGKTTTLYSAVSEIVSTEINVMTIEDPVEYKLSGVAQINVQPRIGFSFPQGLRQILRQDPDVIMVGEIRDVETAAIAVQSSLTGHLVMSTLHTNDAPSAVIRLRDMGIEPYLLSSSLIGVLAQRLVRKLCRCKVLSAPSSLDVKLLNQNCPEKIMSPQGCDLCYNTGFWGRVGVYELMCVTQDVRNKINKECGSDRLRSIAIETGMETLIAHGRQLVTEGITTTSEILQIVKTL